MPSNAVKSILSFSTKLFRQTRIETRKTPQHASKIRRRLEVEMLESRRLFASDFFDSTFLDGQNVPGLLPSSGTIDSDSRSELLLRGIALSPPAPDIKGPPAPPTQMSNEVPIFHSLPNATRKLYLDFNGHLVTNSTWNNQVYYNGYNTGNVINAPPYSIDSDIDNFSAEERNRMRDIWARVAEDFAPFEIDVTTEDPGVDKFTAGGQGIRVLISTDIDRTTGQQWFPLAGGVAYLSSWYFTSDTPVWAFANHLGNGHAKFVAEAVSHEVGHSFNLNHDGRISPREEYYAGHGSGETGWSPLMGVGYDRPLSQFSQGEYASASQREDDLTIISNGAPYRLDDYGDAAGTASTLVPTPTGSVTATGLIHKRQDIDAFSFATQAGAVTFNWEPFERVDGRANLDIELKLFDANGVLLETVNPADRLNATIARTLPRGKYTMTIDGTGRVSVTGHPGYSDYGSLGQYSLVGSVQPNHAPIANADQSSGLVDAVQVIAVLANDSDSDNDPLTILSVSTPDHGIAAIDGTQIRYSPASGYVGLDTFQYQIDDGLGGVSTATVQVQIAEPVGVGAIEIGSGSQRSMVERLKVPFESVVNIQSDAFQVLHRGDNAEVGIAVTTEVVEGKTIATIGFSGTYFAGGSLIDGNYQLRVRANRIADAGGMNIDGDGDGLPGGDLVIGDEEADGFYRWFGDIDGNRLISVSEFNDFRSAFGKSIGDAAYRPEFDFDTSGSIGPSDFNALRSRFGRRLQFG